MIESTADYVLRWGDFIGQGKAVDQIKVAARAACARGERLPHLLLASGLHGIGKTNLGLLAAKEVDAEVHEMTGKVDSDTARIRLSHMEDGDCLFIDEIHRLVHGGKANAEWLLHLLHDGMIIGPKGPEEQPDITIIGTTTDVGRLPDTIISRFPLRPELRAYTREEAESIVIGHFVRTFPDDAPLMSGRNVSDLARAADHNPRTIRQIIAALLDLWQVRPEETYVGDEFVLERAFEWVGVLPDGLTRTAARYLVVLLDEYDGRAGERAMKERLQEPGGLASTERLLVNRGLVAFTKSGRALTGAGINRAKELK